MPGLDLSVDRASDTPLGAQLAGRIRASVRDGALRPGQRLPSVRELAAAVGVNVNTARAVYARLESEGLVRSEQGRGTFVSAPVSEEAGTRHELRRQIAELEAALVRLPPPPLRAAEPNRRTRPGGAALQSTADLAAIRDSLLVRLGELDVQRAEVVERLQQLDVPVQPAKAPSPRRATPSLAGARIRWVGA
jgi:DNA-binding transcriptional regulator YhcF (GntR family)